MPNVKLGDIIKIGINPQGPKAEIVRIYTPEEKGLGLCGDIEVVYWQNRLKGIKEDATWNGDFWDFTIKGPNGSYVNIDHYNARLKS